MSKACIGGVRRYQNKDGSLTSLGRQRYGSDRSPKKKKYFESLERAELIDTDEDIAEAFKKVLLTLKNDSKEIMEEAKKRIKQLKHDKNLNSVGGIPKEYIDMGKDAFKSVAKDPRFIISVAAAIVPGLISLGKIAYRRIKNARENRRKMTTTYDRRTDQYVKLKRPLTAEEQKELAKRMRKGETKTMILEEMKLLK